MNTSIRKFLLVNLLLAITITTTLTVIGNYYLDQKDIQHHLDTLMSISTLSYQALLGDDVNELNLPKIQDSLNGISKRIDEYAGKNILTESQRDYADRVKFQLWGNDGKLLLHSRNAPHLPISSGQEGFSNEIVNGEPVACIYCLQPRSRH